MDPLIRERVRDMERKDFPYASEYGLAKLSGLTFLRSRLCYPRLLPTDRRPRLSLMQTPPLVSSTMDAHTEYGRVATLLDNTYQSFDEYSELSSHPSFEKCPAEPE
jgi:hypothetical protein